MRSPTRILSADFSTPIPFGEVNPLSCNGMICFLSSCCEMMLYLQEDSSSVPKQMFVEKLTHMTFFSLVSMEEILHQLRSMEPCKITG